MGLTGTFISDIFIRDWKKMIERLKKYEDVEDIDKESMETNIDDD